MTCTYSAKDTRVRFALCITYAVVFCLFYLVCRNILPTGDDLFYSGFSKGGLAYFLHRHAEHYMRANGRAIVHFLATVFLALPLCIWQLLHAATLAFCVFASVRLSRTRGFYRIAAALLSAAILMGLDTMITRQSVYWIMGAWNYVYPIAALLAFWMIVSSKRCPPRSMCILTCILAILAGASTEQASMMAVGLCVMEISFACIERRKPSGIQWTTLILTVAGLITVLAAPGLRVRSEITSSPTRGGMLSLLKYNLIEQGKVLFYDELTLSFQLPLMIAGILLCTVLAVRSEKKMPRLGYAFCGICGAGYLVIRILLGTTVFLNPYPMLIRMLRTLGIAGEVFCLIGCGLILALTRRDRIMLYASVLAFGSQAMMLVSETWGTRVMCAFVFMVPVILSRTLALLSEVPTHAESKNRRYLPCIVLTAAICTLCVFSGINHADIVTHTAANAAVYRENLADIDTYRASGSTDTLTQRILPYPGYAWAMPYHNDYYAPYYAITYGLPQNTPMEWIP